MDEAREMQQFTPEGSSRLVRVAGVIWLVFGLSQIALGFYALHLSNRGQPNGIYIPTKPELTSQTFTVAAVVLLIIGLIFAALGFVAIAQKLSEARRVGIGSILLALFPIVCVVYQLVDEPRWWIVSVGLVQSAVLFLAGVIAIVGAPRTQLPRKKAARLDEVAKDPGPPVPFPKSIQIAGIIWLMIGMCQIVWCIFILLQASELDARNRLSQVERELLQFSLWVMAGVVGFIGLAFTITGAQVSTGSVSSVKGTGVASILIACLSFINLMRELSKDPDFVTIGANVILVAGLLLAGLLAINAAGEYRNWRVWMNAKRRAESR